MDGRIEELERRTDARLGEWEVRLDQFQVSIMAVLERLERREDEDEARRRGRDNDDRGRGSHGGRNLRDKERARRVEVPYFNGDDPYGWLFRAERYFRVNHIPVEEQVETATICLEGKALSWFQWWEPRNPLTDWVSFRGAILERFHTSTSGNPYDALMSLRQSSTVGEFREQFEVIAAPLQHADDAIMKAASLG